MTGVLVLGMLTGCGKSESKKDDNVLRVGMECAYAPFNWTQETEEVANGDKAVKIYGSDYYAYGYDVMMAKKIADELGMELEIHKVEWDSIGMAMDAGEYTFVLVIPVNFEKDLMANLDPEIQLNVDATRMSQAFTGAGYIQQIIDGEVRTFLKKNSEKGIAESGQAIGVF